VRVTVVALALVACCASACSTGIDGTPRPTPPPAAAPSRVPSQVLDLTNWNLTLPTGSPGRPDTVQQPALATYSSPFFQVDAGRGGVLCTSDAGGVTTKGSTYPRSELRETNGDELAEWSNRSGTHTLEVRQAVIALPPVKPEVVTAQIHDSEDDVMEVRLESGKLIAQYNDGRTDVTLDPRYTLGTPYDLTITAASGRIRVYYNGAKKLDIAKRGSGWYFKSGSYVQSNTSKGDKASAVGVVVIYKIAAKHTS
jgi:hypothetical protein